MTIEQERDIAVRALERIISDYKNAYLGHLDAKNVAEEALAAIKRAQALQALIDQAQDLDMGYGAAQASPVAPTIKDRLMVADDAITAFEDRYKRDANDPSCAESLRVWCDAWEVKPDSTCKEFLQVAEESPVAQDDESQRLFFLKQWAGIDSYQGTWPDHYVHAWTGWNAARRASVAQPAAQPVGAFCRDCGKRNLGIHTCSPQYSLQPVGVLTGSQRGLIMRCLGGGLEMGWISDADQLAIQSAISGAQPVGDALTFYMRGDKMVFSVGAQSFALDYAPDGDEAFNFMASMLTKAIGRIVQPVGEAVASDYATMQSIHGALSERRRELSHSYETYGLLTAIKVVERMMLAYVAPPVAQDQSAEIQRWKSAHADMVKRCAILREREDLPVDRIPAYKELLRLQSLVAQDQDAARMDRQYLAGFDAGFMAGEAGDIDKRTKVHAARDAAMQAEVQRD